MLAPMLGMNACESVASLDKGIEQLAPRGSTLARHKIIERAVAIRVAIRVAGCSHSDCMERRGALATLAVVHRLKPCLVKVADCDCVSQHRVAG